MQNSNLEKIIQMVPLYCHVSPGRRRLQVHVNGHGNKTQMRHLQLMPAL